MSRLHVPTQEFQARLGYMRSGLKKRHKVSVVGMARWAKALATTPDNLSWIPGTHLVEEEKSSDLLGLPTLPSIQPASHQSL